MVHEAGVLYLGKAHAAESSAEGDADALMVLQSEVQPRIDDRHLRRGDRKLGESVQPLELFALQIFRGIEPVYSRRDMGTEAGGVERANCAYGGSPCPQPLSKSVNANTDRGDSSDAGYHYTSARFHSS